MALRPGAGPAHHEAVVGLDLLAAEQAPVDVFARHRLLHRPRPPHPAGGRAPAVRQARPTAARRPRRPHPGRLRHRHHLRHRDLPLRAHCQALGPRRAAPPATRRQAAGDPAWQADYRRWRPPVERAVAWLVHQGNRRLRYRGTIAGDAWLCTRAAALNLRRLINLGLTRTNGMWHLSTADA
ncbi:transposase [Spirillospora sp. NPDC048819]|uniref:transposase n=1 Tax=Spirillospora sp. NPDC048819 TaxID=3155268 RepID=UPI0033DCE699